MIDMTGRGTFFPNWFHFLCLAAEARDETERKTTADSRKRPAGAALSTILFSALATEAFINELVEAAARNAKPPPGSEDVGDQVLADLAAVLRQVEDNRGQIVLKYQMASRILAGETFPEGQAPFQDFADLIKLRDDLVHPRHRDRTTPAGHVQPSSGVVRNLQQRGLTTTKGRGLGDVPGGISWVEEIESGRVANWAYSSAKEIIAAILIMLPEGDRFSTNLLFRARLDGLPQ